MGFSISDFGFVIGKSNYKGIYDYQPNDPLEIGKTIMYSPS